MKNLSKINEEHDQAGAGGPSRAVNFDDIIFDLQKNQAIKGENRIQSVCRTVSFFDTELPERLLSTINSVPSVFNKFRRALAFKKTKILVFSCIQPSGEIFEIYEECEHLFFDNSVISDLIIETNNILDELRYEIKNRQRRILILAEQDRQVKKQVLDNLVLRSWQHLAFQLPPPTPKIENLNLNLKINSNSNSNKMKPSSTIMGYGS